MIVVGEGMSVEQKLDAVAFFDKSGDVLTQATCVDKLYILNKFCASVFRYELMKSLKLLLMRSIFIISIF